MLYLLIVSLIWAFSFGLIKGNLTGLDSNFVAAVRLMLSMFLFLPFLRIRKIRDKEKWSLVLVGMIQYGIMYLTYIYAFQFLKAYEVALFTIFTPIYVTLINDAIEKRFNWRNLLAALLAVMGTGIVEMGEMLRGGLLQGFIIVQISNLAFAIGQIWYRKLMIKSPDVKDQQVFGLLFLGGFLLTVLTTLVRMDWVVFEITLKQILTLVYLGLVASGLGFFLWNFGARRTEVGVLAVFNNLKIPLAVAVSLVFFRENANLVYLLLGSAVVIFALLIDEKGLRNPFTRQFWVSSVK
jgi:drug/metabolite transporter (DMT)-like permease